jgi:capsular polysaccharide biosynthesis protein
VPGWWHPDPQILCNPVQLFRVRDAFHMPGFGAVISPEGGVMQHSVGQARHLVPDLAGLPQVSRTDERVVFHPPAVLPHLPACIVSMPWGGIYNYGHFVCDCLTSLALLSQKPELAGLPRVFPPLKPWHRRHLQLLGLEPVELDQPLYRAENVLFTSGMWQFLNVPNTSYRTLRDAQLNAKCATDIRFDKVYVTGSEVAKLNPNRRRFLSEAALEQQLRALGFAVVAPELLEIDEQIDLFRNARVIVACRGAALANVVYCRPDTTIIEILPVIAGFEGYVWVRNICALVSCRWRPYFCAGIAPEQPVVTAGQVRPNAGFTFDADISDLVRFIQAADDRDS